MRVKFITAIYSNLHGTEFGGRPSRGTHYRWSLLSLLRMTDADFTCFTSENEYEDLSNFFYDKNGINKKKLEIKVFDLKNSVFFNQLYEIKSKKIEEYKSWDRCLEIQYNKFFWFDDEDKSYDYYFWIDAGISHCGLLPDMWLNKEKGYESQFYSTNVFDNKFLKNLIDFTGEKIFIIAKDNLRNYWSGTVDPKHYTNFNQDYHIIGGLFGGRLQRFQDLVDLFKRYLYLLLDEGNTPMEENILSLINVNHSDLFERKYFDVWWHPQNGPKGLDSNFFEVNKSFYKIIEELISDE